MELGLNASSCHRPTGALQDQVQVSATRLDLLLDVVHHLPPLALSAVSGSLSDRLGRKPLLLFPLFGACLSSLFSLLHLTVFGDVPAEFFLLESFQSYLGAPSLYYMGASH